MMSHPRIERAKREIVEIVYNACFATKFFLTWLAVEKVVGFDVQEEMYCVAYDDGDYEDRVGRDLIKWPLAQAPVQAQAPPSTGSSFSPVTPSVVATFSHSMFEVGSKVEARWGGGADWFPGTVRY
jgi:hypothetical protein